MSERVTTSHGSECFNLSCRQSNVLKDVLLVRVDEAPQKGPFTLQTSFVHCSH